MNVINLVQFEHQRSMPTMMQAFDVPVNGLFSILVRNWFWDKTELKSPPKSLSLSPLPLLPTNTH